MQLAKPQFFTPTESNPKEEIMAHKLCTIVGKQLQEHYPGYRWLVECTFSTGVITVKNQHLHGDYGFVLHIMDVVHDTMNQLPVRAGGELLERCGLPRGPRPEDMSFLRRDLQGNVIMDIQGAEKK